MIFFCRRLETKANNFSFLGEKLEM